MAHVVTVSGAVGGVGASTLAYALALQPYEGAVLIDAQLDGAPLDILIGSEDVPGARWSQVRVQSDAIDAETILCALPEVGGIHVLSADRAARMDARALHFLVQALRSRCSLIVVDIAARDAARPALKADMHLLVMPPTLLGLGAALSAPELDLLVIANTGAADFGAANADVYLDAETAGVVRWQRAVTMAAAQCLPPPPGTDVMQLAGQLWGRLCDGL